MRFVHLGLLVALNLEIPTSTYVTYMPTVRVTKWWGTNKGSLYCSSQTPRTKPLRERDMENSSASRSTKAIGMRKEVQERYHRVKVRFWADLSLGRGKLDRECIALVAGADGGCCCGRR